jgi:UDP-glucose 4-epimerase
MPDLAMQTSVLVTGASGFVGRFVCEDLRARGFDVFVTRRGGPDAAQDRVTSRHYDLATPGALTVDELRGIDAVVHLAARVHVMDKRARNEEHFRQFNVTATERLAHVAAAAGVRRFVFMSTIKVNGEATTDSVFRSEDLPSPAGAYAVSKHLAELAVRAVAAQTGMEIVVVRPPLVYGPGVGGNFLRMMRWIDNGWPLPFASIRNQRSYVSVWNLADLVGTALVHPAAGGRNLLVSDGRPMSTAELVRLLAASLGRSPNLKHLPEYALRFAARLLGREEDIDRLCGSLVVDDSATRALLGWSPPATVETSVARTVDWYRESR